jgi:parvulin-like peptidyl-prolyl isomerase
MIALDQAQEKAEGLEMLQVVGSFFDQMKAMIEQYPPLATFSMAILSNLIRRFKGGEEVEGLFQNALGTITQMAQQREQAASQQQPTDPAMMQLQMQMQVEQMKADLKRYEIENKTTVEQQKLILAQQELDLKNNELQIEMMKVQAQASGKVADQEIKKEHNRMQSLLDLQRLELERVATRLSETEKLLEERRLSQQQELEVFRTQMQSGVVPSEKQQPIVINNIIPKPTKRVGVIGVDQMGNTTLSVDNIEE